METEGNNKKVKFDFSIFDGLFKKNAVLVGGLIIAPIVGITTFKNALIYTVLFSIITFLTIMISAFVPREIVYAVRIILYSFIGSLVYVPVAVIAHELFPNEIISLGVFVPLIITNSLIVSKTEVYFFRLSKGRMISEVLCYIIGFDIAFLCFAFIREVLSFGSIGNTILGIPLTFHALNYTFGGFIFLGLFSALFRKIYISVRGKQ